MKKIKFAIVILAIIGMTLSLYLIFNPKIRAYRKLDKIMDKKEMKSGLAIPNKLYELGAVYTGRLSTQNICKFYDNLSTNIIPKYYIKCKNLDEDQIQEFYNKNKDIIFIELGDDNYGDFRSLLSEVMKLNGDKLEYETSRLIAESIVKNHDGISVDIAIKYKNNDEILLNSFVKNKKSQDSSSIVFTRNVTKM